MTSKEMWVRCGKCEHKWLAAYLPMELEKVARIMRRLSCPKCAEIRKIHMCEPETHVTHVSVGSGGGSGRIKTGGGSVRGHITIPAGGPEGWAGETK